MQAINDPQSSVSNVLNMNNIYQDLHGELLKGYFQDCAFTKPMIDAYDKWLEILLPNFLKKGYSFRNGTRLWIENIRIVKKRLPNNNIKFPHYCRLNDETYDIRIEGDFFFKDINGNITNTVSETGNKITIADIPLMVGSRHCSLHTIKTPKWEDTYKKFMELGEDPADPFGYFIINGSERIVLCQEKTRLNAVLNIVKKIEKKDIKSKDIAQSNVSIIKCTRTFDTQFNTKLFELTEGKHKALKVYLNFFSIKENKKHLLFPAFLLFRHESLNKENNIPLTGEDIINMIIKFVKNDKINLVKNYLINTLIKFEIHTDIYKYYHRKTFKDGSVYENVKDKVKNNFDYMFVQDFFPNCPNKAEMYAFVIARYTETILGIRPPDDRDVWATKRVEWAPRSMENLFISSWNLMMKGETTGLEKYVNNPNTTAKTMSSNFKQNYITDIFRSSFTGVKWGKKKTIERMTEALERKSLTHLYSQLTKVNVNTTAKAQFSIRIVQGDQYGYICPAEVAEGEMCGITKHLASTAILSLERDMNQVIETIFKYCKDLFSDIKVYPFINPFFVNGNLLSWAKGNEARVKLISMRRSQMLPMDVSVILEDFDFKHPEIENDNSALYVYCDAGRLIRPLLICENGELLLVKKNITNYKFDNMLREGVVEFIDPHETNYILLGTSFSHLKVLKQEYDKVTKDLNDKLSKNNKSETELLELENLYKAQQIAKYRLQVTHVELDPVSMFGYAASMVPMPNRIHGPRVGYNAAASRQAMNNLMHIIHENRFDTAIKVLSFPVQPNFRTNMMDTIRSTSGRTLFIGIMPYMGNNQEDAIILNKEVNDNLYFAYTKFITKTVDINVNNIGNLEKLGIPKEKMSNIQYRNLSPNGIIKVGSYINLNDILVAKSAISTDSKKGESIRETSVSAGMDDLGIVDKVLAYGEKNSNRITIKIKIRKYHPRLEIGDKLSMRYSQKGVVGKILPPERMPVVVGGPLNGRAFDIIINPHCIPSRMTTAVLIELLTGKYTSMMGEKINATAFRDFDIDEFKKKLELLGMNMNGLETVMNPENGEIYENKINCGFIYYMSLPHIVEEKFQVRGNPIGKNDPITGQPLGGRSRGGGIRAGEMEGWSFISHGAINFALDRTMVSSDDYQAAMCQKCSSIVNPTPTASGIEFVCKNNCNAIVGKIRMPFSMKRFTDIVRVAGIDMKYKPMMKNMKLIEEEVVVDENDFYVDDEEVEEEVDEDVDEEFDDI